MQQQRVRGKKDPKIQVIDKEVFENPIESVKVPTWNALLDGNEMDAEDISKADEIRIEVDLELLVSGKAIVLKANEIRVEVSVGRIYFLGLWLPFSINVKTLKATFDCVTRKLILIGNRKVLESTDFEPAPVKVTPVSLSRNNLLYDII